MALGSLRKAERAAMPGVPAFKPGARDDVDPWRSRYLLTFQC